MQTPAEAVRAIEDAVHGMSGAAYTGDVAYAERRRQDIFEAAAALRGSGFPLEALFRKLTLLCDACHHRAFARAVELNHEISLLFLPFK